MGMQSIQTQAKTERSLRLQRHSWVPTNGGWIDLIGREMTTAKPIAQPLRRTILASGGTSLAVIMMKAILILCKSRGSSRNAVFPRQKFLQGLGQYRGEFLPCQQLQAAAQRAAPDRAHDRIPFFNQVRASGVAQDAK